MAAHDRLYGDDLMQYDLTPTALITPEQQHSAALTLAEIAARRNALTDLPTALAALGITPQETP